MKSFLQHQVFDEAEAAFFEQETISAETRF
jgi:hypothetical protein